MSKSIDITQPHLLGLIFFIRSSNKATCTYVRSTYNLTTNATSNLPAYARQIYVNVYVILCLPLLPKLCHQFRMLIKTEEFVSYLIRTAIDFVITILCVSLLLLLLLHFIAVHSWCSHLLLKCAGRHVLLMSQQQNISYTYRNTRWWYCASSVTEASRWKRKCFQFTKFLPCRGGEFSFIFPSGSVEKLYPSMRRPGMTLNDTEVRGKMRVKLSRKVWALGRSHGWKR